jgi:galactokinase
MDGVSATAARELFERSCGRRPEGVWSAPGRVNLIGEHTDYNGGLVLPIALPHRTYAACGRRADGILRVTSAQTGETVEVEVDEIRPGRPEGWATYVAGVLWALRTAGHDIGGLDVAVTSEVPLGAGLSSSAALECAVGAACSDLFGLFLLDGVEPRSRLVTECRRAENIIAQAPTGGMDQAASLLCEADHALLLDCRSWRTEQVPFDLSGHGLTLLVIDTRAEHELVDGQYGDRRTSCEAAADRLEIETLREIPLTGLDGALARLCGRVVRQRVRHVVTEIDRVDRAVEALRADDLDTLGSLLTASHLSLRDDYEVSCAELDTAVEAALAAGALGARMTGGGFGGSAIALVRSEASDAVASAVRTAFAERGFSEPVSFPVRASSPARRDL